jgi:hypothetical protein
MKSGVLLISFNAVKPITISGKFFAALIRLIKQSNKGENGLINLYFLTLKILEK